MSSSYHSTTPSYFTSLVFFFSSRRRHTRYIGDWSSDVCSSDLAHYAVRVEPRIVDAHFDQAPQPALRHQRSEERRVGKECRSRWSRYHEKKEKTSVEWE